MKSTTSTTTNNHTMKALQTTTLSDLAQAINREHAEVTAAAQRGLEHARRAGELLDQAKAQVGHGGWLPWLEANCEVSARTAQAYMRVARRWAELAGDAQRVADLSFREALKILAEPKVEEDQGDNSTLIDEDGPGDLDRQPGDARYIPSPGCMLIGEYFGSTPESDDVVWVVPHKSREGLYYVVRYYIEPGSLSLVPDMVDGNKRPTADVNLGVCMRVWGMKPEKRSWVELGPRSLEQIGWSYNRALYDSEEDYYNQHVLGRA